MSYSIGAVSPFPNRFFELEGVGDCSICCESLYNDEAQETLIALHNDSNGLLHPVHQKCWSAMQQHTQAALRCPSCRGFIDPNKVIQIHPEDIVPQLDLKLDVTFPMLIEATAAEKKAVEAVLSIKIKKAGLEFQLAALDTQEQELNQNYERQCMKRVSIVAAAALFLRDSQHLTMPEKKIGSIIRLHKYKTKNNPLSNLRHSLKTTWKRPKGCCNNCIREWSNRKKQQSLKKENSSQS